MTPASLFLFLLFSNVRVDCFSQPRNLYVVSLKDRLAYDDRVALFQKYRLHHERHLFRNPASYLLTLRGRLREALAGDPLVESVEQLYPSHKSSLFRTYRHGPSIRTSMNISNLPNDTNWRNSTLNKEVELICHGDPNHTHRESIAPDLLKELSHEFTEDLLHPRPLRERAVELEVTTLCFYNARDCTSNWMGRFRELRSLIGDDAKFVDDKESEGGHRVLVVRVPRNLPLCTVAKRLATHHFVVRIERRMAYTPLNAFAAAAVQTGAKDPVSISNAAIWKAGFLGQGEVVGVGDTGVDLDSCYFREQKKLIDSRDEEFQKRAATGSYCDMNRRKVICYFTTSKADFGDDASMQGGGHGTHVTGTVGGLHEAAVNDTNNIEALVKHITKRHSEMNGIAPLAKLSVNDIGANSGKLYPPIDFATSSFLSAPYSMAGMRIHSNSWGCGGHGGSARLCNKYSVLARSMDEFMWLNKDTLIVMAAGNLGDIGSVDIDSQALPKFNNGYYTVGAPATFKNGIAVGATQRGEPLETCVSFDDNGEPCSFENLFTASSRGPTLDGRIKPDIVFPGEKIVSAYSSGNANDMSEGKCKGASLFEGVHVISGTSMACPGVAGALALIRQYYREVNPMSGEKWDYESGPLGDGLGPSGALLKATIIASAMPLGGHFTYRPGERADRKKLNVRDAPNPAYISGFGRPQLDRALRLNAKSTIRLLVFDRYTFKKSAQVHRYTFRVGFGGYWKAVLTYTDSPGPVQEAWEDGIVLVNDLDLVAYCAEEEDCNINTASLVSESRVDNVEILPRFDGKTRIVKVRRDTIVTIRVIAHSIVTKTQPYALVIVGTKLSYVAERSMKANWKPDWSRNVKKPSGSNSEDVQKLAMKVAIAVVSATAVIILMVMLWNCCRGNTIHSRQ